MSSIARGFHNFEEDLLGKKATRKIDKFEKKAGKYLTSTKKGGFGSDIINYGVPALTGAIGGAVGSLAGGVGGVAGSAIGSKLGKEFLTPKLNKIAGYKTGGKVPQTGLALIHKGEYVLPAGVAPTKTQIEAVARKKRHEGKKGKVSLVTSDRNVVVFA
jgi:hypothetical protein